MRHRFECIAIYHVYFIAEDTRYTTLSKLLYRSKYYKIS